MNTIALQAGAPGYPAAMTQLAAAAGRWASPPPTLYLRGSLPCLPGIAVVGTRRASEEALAFTEQLCSAIAQAGWAVWSGGARGVDAAAHRAALDAGGATVVVTAGGLTSAYPAEHEPLYRRVLERGGALLSLQADDEHRQRHHFLQRNAVLAALTRATLLIQAPCKSGARSTCSAARRLGRPLLVVPGAPYDELAAGCALELVRGAWPLSSAKQLQAALRALLAGKRYLPPQIECVEGEPLRPLRLREPQRTRASLSVGEQQRLPGDASRPSAVRSTHARIPRRPLPVALAAEARLVLRVLSDASQHQDELARRCGLSAQQLAAALLDLRLHGLAEEAPLGHYRLS